MYLPLPSYAFAIYYHKSWIRNSTYARNQRCCCCCLRLSSPFLNQLLSLLSIQCNQRGKSRKITKVMMMMMMINAMRKLEARLSRKYECLKSLSWIQTHFILTFFPTLCASFFSFNLFAPSTIFTYFMWVQVSAHPCVLAWGCISLSRFLHYIRKCLPCCITL